MCENCRSNGDEEEASVPTSLLRALGLAPPDPMAEARNSLAKHEVRDFVLSLTDDQKQMLHQIVNVTTNVPGSGHFYMGMIAALRDQQHDTCLACGKNHDKMTQDMLDEAITPGLNTAPKAAYPEADDAPEYPDEPEMTLEYYNLVEKHGRIICKGCGTEYVSLKDRARRAPGKIGCEGCILKEKWG